MRPNALGFSTAAALMAIAIMVGLVFHTRGDASEATAPAKDSSTSVPDMQATAITTPEGEATPSPRADETVEPAKPSPTACGFRVEIKKGEDFLVIGPGSEVKTIPSPGDYVTDPCTGEVFFRDPDTGDPLPSTGVATSGEETDGNQRRP